MDAVQAQPADRVWTVPNALSFLRLLGVPLFLWLLLGPHADGWGLALYDGKTARTFLEPAAAANSALASFVRAKSRDGCAR